MAKDEAKAALVTLFPMIADRFKRAHSLAAAANTCAAAGDLDAAFRILLDVEQLEFDARRLLDVSSVFKQELDE